MARTAILTLLAGLVLTPIAWAARPSPGEVRALAAIKKLGGTIECAGGAEDGPVFKISFRGTKVNNAGLVLLKSFPNLEELDLTDTKVTDAGLLALPPLARLQKITITGTAITKSGVDTLKGRMPDLAVIAEIDPAARELPPLVGAKAYLTRARSWIDASETDKAIVDLSHCLELEPTNATAWVSAGSSGRVKRSSTRPCKISTRPSA